MDHPVALSLIPDLSTRDELAIVAEIATDAPAHDDQNLLSLLSEVLQPVDVRMVGTERVVPVMVDEHAPMGKRLLEGPICPSDHYGLVCDFQVQAVPVETVNAEDF